MSIGGPTGRYPIRQKDVYVSKGGETIIRYYPGARTYHRKLHHPDREEIEQIHTELARGDLRKEIAPRHQLTERRLRALLVKYPPGCFVDPPGCLADPPECLADPPECLAEPSPALSAGEAEALLAEYLDGESLLLEKSAAPE